MRRLLCTTALAGALSAAAQMAYAQAEDQAAARALFDDARRLILEKNYEAACPKFEASRKLYPSAGTLRRQGA
jgi:outer membrane protein assembly factor BamD (BamD/ComL family)